MHAHALWVNSVSHALLQLQLHWRHGSTLPAVSCRIMGRPEQRKQERKHAATSCQRLDCLFRPAAKYPRNVSSGPHAETVTTETDSELITSLSDYSRESAITDGCSASVPSIEHFLQQWCQCFQRFYWCYLQLFSTANVLLSLFTNGSPQHSQKHFIVNWCWRHCDRVQIRRGCCRNTQRSTERKCAFLKTHSHPNDRFLFPTT